MDDTLFQIGSGTEAAGAGAGPGEPPARPGATVCPLCGQHISADGRFCPFDGEPLRPAPDWDPKSDPLLGTVVDGRYEISTVIGEGGMGVVYAARHRTLGKRFALKALRPDLATDREIAARFMQEARTAASVSHPGLVEIIDFGKLPSGQPFFVMELLEGQSLAQLIRRGGPLPAARAIEFVRQIADALGTAHDRSIVHRDLKPDNIHISRGIAGKDHVTIVDFGLAKVIGSSRLTRAGMVFGTPHYMSPEQAQGDPTDHRADIYALGVVMYEMFTGRVPFEADSYMGVLTKHMYMAPTPPSQLPGTEDLGVLEAMMLRCLQKKPEHRYQVMSELCQELDRSLLAAGVRPADPSLPRPRSLLADELELPTKDELGMGLDAALPKPWPRWPLIVVGALFLAGIGGVLGLRSGQPPRAATPALSLSGSGATAISRSGADVMDALPSVTHAETTRPAIEAEPQRASASGAASAPRKAKAAARPLSQAAPSSASTPPTAGKKPARVGSSEIVDPWGR